MLPLGKECTGPFGCCNKVKIKNPDCFSAHPVVLTRSETGGHKPTLKCRSRTCAGKTRRVDAYDLISSFLLSVRQFHNGIEHP